MQEDSSSKALARWLVFVAALRGLSGACVRGQAGGALRSTCRALPAARQHPQAPCCGPCMMHVLRPCATQSSLAS